MKPLSCGARAALPRPLGNLLTRRFSQRTQSNHRPGDVRALRMFGQVVDEGLKTRVVLIDTDIRFLVGDPISGQ
jgi:hypothetical protein